MLKTPINFSINLYGDDCAEWTNNFLPASADNTKTVYWYAYCDKLRVFRIGYRLDPKAQFTEMMTGFTDSFETMCNIFKALTEGSYNNIWAITINICNDYTRLLRELKEQLRDNAETMRTLLGETLFNLLWQGLAK